MSDVGGAVERPFKTLIGISLVYEISIVFLILAITIMVMIITAAVQALKIACVLSRGGCASGLRCRLHLATEDLIPPTLSSPITCSAKNVQAPLHLIHDMICSTTALYGSQINAGVVSSLVPQPTCCWKRLFQVRCWPYIGSE